MTVGPRDLTNLSRRNIPDGLAGVFEKQPVQKIITLAMDANDNYFCYWEKVNGGNHWGMHDVQDSASSASVSCE